MNCSEYEESVYVYAAGALEGPERDELLAHLAGGCPECAAKLAGAEAVLGLVGVSAMGVGGAGLEVRAGVKATLDERLDRLHGPAGVSEERGRVGALRTPGSAASNGFHMSNGSDGRIAEAVGSAEREGLGVAGSIRAGGAGGSGTPGRRRFAWVFPASLAAVLAAGVTSGVMWMMLQERETQIAGLMQEISGKAGMVEQREQELADAQEEVQKLKDEAGGEGGVKAVRDELEKAKGRVKELEKDRTALDTQLVALRKDHEEDQRTIEMLHSKQLLAVDLKGQPGANAGAQARLLLDMEGKVWKLYGVNFKPIEGRVYEFWLVTADGKKLPMGTFTPDEKGRGELGDKVPEPMPTVVAVAITDEPVGGSPEPTGSMQAVGKLQ